MPISIDEFESRDPDPGETSAERVVWFLPRNRDKAYRAVEITDATDINENSIHPVLNRLEDREPVHHRKPYWAIGDLGAVCDATMVRSTVAYLDETLGSESRQEWLDAAREDEESGD